MEEETYPKYSEFKGNPVISLNKFFSFGLAKAKLIIANYPAILKFVETESSKSKNTSETTEKV
jgi:hypothetical protein